MKRLIIFLTLCLPLWCSCGGGNRTAEKLRDVETYIGDRPDSAYEVLCSIDPDRLSRRLRARCLLLKSIALDKNYVDLTDDSLITPAVKWYERHGRDENRMLAYYYQGRVFQNAGDLIPAMMAFHNAEKAAKECEDDFYLGMIYRGISELNIKTFNTHEQLKYAELSCEHFERANAEKHKNHEMLEVALAHHNAKQFDTSKQICLEIKKIAENTSDTVLLQNCLSLYMSDLISDSEPEPEKAIEIFSYITDSLYYSPTFEDWIYIAIAYTYAQQSETAEQIMNAVRPLAEGNDVAEAEIANVQMTIDKYRNDHKQAFHNLQKAVMTQDSLFYGILNQSVVSAQKEYFRRQAEADEYRLHMQKIVIILIVIFSVISMTLLSLFWRQRLKNRERERKEQTAKMIKLMEDTLKNDLRKSIEEENRSALDEFREKINSLYLAKFRFFDEICKQYYSFSSSSANQKQIYKTVEKKIGRMADDEEERALEEILNTFKNGIMSRLRAQFPKFKEDDFKLLCYWFAGFSPSAMAVFLKEDDINNIYQKRSRLKARIEKSDAPDRTFFIQNLPK